MSEYEVREDAPPGPDDELSDTSPPQPDENEPSPHEGEEGQRDAS